MLKEVYFLFESAAQQRPLWLEALPQVFNHHMTAVIKLFYEIINKKKQQQQKSRQPEALDKNPACLQLQSDHCLLQDTQRGTVAPSSGPKPMKINLSSRR